jgi:capsular exopolysaccharide synthesis family protein
MDRISKAVIKARHEREAKIDGVQPSTRPRRDRDVPVRGIEISPEILRENRVISGEVNDAYSHAYKVLRTRVWQQMRSNGWKTLGVTSANPGEGKTLTAINLAVSLAMMEVVQSVILVDLDMRHPSVHSYFGFWPEHGVSDYLMGGATLAEMFVDPGVGKVVLLPSNVPIANSSELLSSSKVQHMIQEIKARFPSSLILFDLPPLLVTDDVLVFAPSVDAFLFVIEEGKSQSNEVTHAIDMLSDANLLGTVLNKSEEAAHGYGY